MKRTAPFPGSPRKRFAPLHQRHDEGPSIVPCKKKYGPDGDGAKTKSIDDILKSMKGKNPLWKP